MEHRSAPQVRRQLVAAEPGRGPAREHDRRWCASAAGRPGRRPRFHAGADSGTPRAGTGRAWLHTPAVPSAGPVALATRRTHGPERPASIEGSRGRSSRGRARGRAGGMRPTSGSWTCASSSARSPPWTASPRDPRGRVLLAPGAVRLRQDHDPADDRRLRAADGRPDPPRRPRHHDGAARAAAREHGVPELRAVPAPHGVRERRVRPPPPQDAGRRGPPPGRRRRWSSSASAATTGASRTSSRAASSSASPSPGRSSTGRRCCCSTSRSAPWTSSSAASSRWSSSGSSSRSGSRSST